MPAGDGVRRQLAAAALAVLLVACGGGGDNGTVELEDAQTAAAIQPCDFVDEDDAAELSGGDVEAAETTTAADGTATCSFASTDGSAIAASLSIGPGSADDLPTGRALARSLDMGDGGAVETSDDEVRVLYVVEETLVAVEVVPADGEVTEELVDEAVEFTETTVEPVTDAVKARPDDAAATTTSEAVTTTTEPDPTTTTEPVEEVVPLEVGGASVTASFDSNETITYGFDAVAGDVIRVEVVDIVAADPVLDATNPCVNITIVAPGGGFGSFCSFDLAQRPARDFDINETGAYTMRLTVGLVSASTVVFQVVPGG